MGPGLTAGEGWLTLLASLVGVGSWLLIVWQGETDFSSWQTAVGGLIMFDLAGGLVANATSTTKRWYHRPGQTRKHHLGFVLPHLLHIGAVAWLFQDGSWQFALGWCGMLLALKAQNSKILIINGFAFCIAFNEAASFHCFSSE